MERTLADLLEDYEYYSIPKGILVEGPDGKRYRTGPWINTGLFGEYEDNGYSYLQLERVSGGFTGIYENQYSNYTIIEDD